jgi:hypothetical protein
MGRRAVNTRPVAPDERIITMQSDYSAGEPVFYVLHLGTVGLKTRLKLGWTSNLHARIQTHQCTTPEAGLIGVWPCPQHYEHSAIKAITAKTAKQVRGEVYDSDNLRATMIAADAFFAAFSLFYRPDLTKPPGIRPVDREVLGWVKEYIPGRWRGIMSMGSDVNGRRRRVCATGNSEREVREKLKVKLITGQQEYDRMERSIQRHAARATRHG